jgi:hypothetical protein
VEDADLSCDDFVFFAPCHLSVISSVSCCVLLHPSEMSMLLEHGPPYILQVECLVSKFFAHRPYYDSYFFNASNQYIKVGYFHIEKQCNKLGKL